MGYFLAGGVIFLGVPPPPGVEDFLGNLPPGGEDFRGGRILWYTGTEVVRRGDEIQQNATQPVEAPGAGMATDPGPEVLLSGSAAQSDSEEDL